MSRSPRRSRGAPLVAVVVAALVGWCGLPPLMAAAQPDVVTDCDWYGTLTDTIQATAHPDVATDAAAGVQTSAQLADVQGTELIHLRFVSTPSPAGCGASWSIDRRLASRATPGGGCVIASEAVEAPSSGIGTLTGTVLPGRGGRPPAFSAVGASAESYPQSLPRSQFSCPGGHPQLPPGETAEALLTRTCTAGDPTPEQAVLSTQVQAVTGSCSADAPTPFTAARPGWTATETWTWSFRRTICDPSVDSDGDGRSDCAEFDLGSNPSGGDEGDSFAGRADHCPPVEGHSRCLTLALSATQSFRDAEGTERGKTQVVLRGSGLSQVAQLCVTDTWTAVIDDTRLTSTVRWNGSPAERLAVRTDAYDVVIEPTSRVRTLSGFAESVTLLTCSSAPAVGGRIAVSFPLTLRVVSIGGWLMGVSHRVTASATSTTGAVLATLRIPRTGQGLVDAVWWAEAG